MGDLDVLTVTLALAGVVILYGAIKNKNPLEVLKLTLQGKDINLAKPLATPTAVGASPSAGTPGSVDSLGVSGLVDGILKNLGIDGSVVIIPYQGHPVGSKATDCDVPGFLGGVDGENHSFPTSDPRFHCTGVKGAKAIPKTTTYVTPYTTGTGGGFT
jgi:hypothetical protein